MLVEKIQKAAENRTHGSLFLKLIARAKKVAHHAQEMSTATAATTQTTRTTETLEHFGGRKSRPDFRLEIKVARSGKGCRRLQMSRL